jgi:hypothetical protein
MLDKHYPVKVQIKASISHIRGQVQQKGMECQDLAHRPEALQISTARVLLTSSFCHFLNRPEGRFGMIFKRWHALNADLWISGS